MACAPKTAKFLLFAFNFLFFVSGLIILITGAVVKSNEYEFEGVYEASYYGVAVLMIVVGCFITVVSFFGCCGAIRESKCMLYTFSAILALIFILEISGGIAAYVHRGDIEDHFTNGMSDSLCDPHTEQSWANMQQELGCCGVNNYTDYAVNATCHKNPAQELPSSCCKLNTSGCSSLSPTLFHQGCKTIIIAQVESHMYLIGGIAIGFAFVQLLGIVLACYLGKSLTFV